MRSTGLMVPLPRDVASLVPPHPRRRSDVDGTVSHGFLDRSSTCGRLRRTRIRCRRVAVRSGSGSIIDEAAQLGKQQAGRLSQPRQGISLLNRTDGSALPFIIKPHHVVRVTFFLELSHDPATPHRGRLLVRADRSVKRVDGSVQLLLLRNEIRRSSGSVTLRLRSKMRARPAGMIAGRRAGGCRA